MLQLSKAETKELEHESTPIFNLTSGYLHDPSLGKDEFLIRGLWGPLVITSWYMTWDLTANRFQQKRDKLIELLGMRPNYHVTYEYKNAVWGLDMGGQLCMLYTSIKGTSLQVELKPSVQRNLRAILVPLVECMINWEFLESGTEDAKLAKKFMSMR